MEGEKGEVTKDAEVKNQKGMSVKVDLAISLHAARDSLRDVLVPLNKQVRVK